MLPIFLADSLLLKDDDDNVHVESQPSVAALLRVIEKASPKDLERCRLGDLCQVVPYSATCTQLLGYCLTWELILLLCGSSTSELRYQYAEFLSNAGLIQKLMDNLFRKYYFSHVRRRDV